MPQDTPHREPPPLVFSITRPLTNQLGTQVSAAELLFVTLMTLVSLPHLPSEGMDQTSKQATEILSDLGIIPN